ncbi:hypothetical protein [Enterococcus pallens]|uniref:Uncharacterized protein n=1 Tax=Enterococcus pallens ATCC BAA-351 TaxID=1158607 RepID=R2T0N8_9ENTE|nr:hypothetical protein [Enterococcus pallens]EOH93819.1 hypothetical protein UAU_02515 [Enterococcus pallens ATCC BAA-351]EOU24659.1 hypothetical protein I588_00646 [Enterococcus pallens ATCC BAA-351]OJG79519.1 hypothetical protein RV10_GL000646 [Enterococcus pallens]
MKGSETMKKMLYLFSLLFLVLLTASSYTLAKYTDKRTFVIGVNDLKYKDKEAPKSTKGETYQLTKEAQDDIKEGEDPLSLTPEKIVEASYDGQIHQLSFDRKGVYAIQLYSGTSLDSETREIENDPSYLAAYVENPGKLHYYLGNQGVSKTPNNDLEAVNQQAAEPSKLFTTDEINSFMQVDENSSSLDEAVLTKISPASALHELLSAYQTKAERNYQGRLIVTYLGPSESLKQIEELNQ